MSNDEERIKKFLDDVSTVLSTVVDCRAILFQKERRKRIDDAWSDIKRRISSLKNKFDEESPGLRQKLEDAALTGSQLEFKLNEFDTTYNQFILRGSIKLLKKVLKRINVILKSLLAAVPGASAVTEFKDMLELDIEDMEDDA